MKYRPEIDGLRAVAVLPVIAFHAGFPPLSGGYIGVDVFFVISGYLITTILLLDIGTGNFSILRFYDRRIRRIIPALFFVMACSACFAWLWMLPEQLSEFAQSTVAVSLFLANFLFWWKTDYFAPSAEQNVLLHTWSLSVEEQFYIVFPIFLYVFSSRYFRRYLVPIIIVMCLASFLISEIGWRMFPSANFYLLPSRAWELGVGALCALLLPLTKPDKVSVTDEIFSIIGLLCVSIPIFVYNGSTPFPSLATIPPVLGAALIIYFSSSRTMVGRLLASRYLVGVGLISYSAYLWHQPLFAFARIRSLTEPSPQLMAILAISVIPLSWFTWRFIERPFRKPTAGFGRAAVFSAATVATFIFIVGGAFGYITEGFPSRFTDRVLELASPRFPDPRNGCTTGGKIELIPNCLANVRPSVVLIGDSHANAIAGALQDLLPPHYGFSNMYAAGCPPFPGYIRQNETAHNACNKYAEHLWSALEEYKPELVIVAARWTLYAEGTRFDNGEGGVEPAGLPPLFDTINRGGQSFGFPSDHARKKRVLSEFVRQINLLATKYPVFLVYPIPEAGWDVPAQSAKTLLYKGAVEDISTDQTRFKLRNKDVSAAFDLINNSNIHRIYAERIFCGTFISGRCANSLGESVLYYDNNHLSYKGAAYLAQAAANIIKTKVVSKVGGDSP